MKIPVKVISISETHRGVSSTTGKPWAQQSVLLGFEDETGDSYISAQVSEDVCRQLGLRKDEVMELNLKFRTSRFKNGFIYNDIRIVPPTDERP